mmetsp:Transcript_14562/g.49306  ORF Transcript_14562/g.49306 Transcript_14562/m.49306 type:complete len:265 (+) Transcript_14562:401-1195(+)
MRMERRLSPRPIRSSSIRYGGGPSVADADARAWDTSAPMHCRNMARAVSKRVPLKMRPNWRVPEPWRSYRLRGSSASAILEKLPIGWSTCRGKRSWCRDARVSTRSAACPRPALISDQSTGVSGSRPRRRPLMVPKGPANQMSNTSSSTLVALRRSSSRRQWARTSALARCSSAARSSSSCAALTARQCSSVAASASASCAARPARSLSTSSCARRTPSSSRSSCCSSACTFAISARRLSASASASLGSCCSSASACRRTSFWL